MKNSRNYSCNVGFCNRSYVFVVQGDTKKRELLKNPPKIEEIQEKKNIERY
jgi:hypothetical protein